MSSQLPTSATSTASTVPSLLADEEGDVQMSAASAGDQKSSVLESKSAPMEVETSEIKGLDMDEDEDGDVDDDNKSAPDRVKKHKVTACPAELKNKPISLRLNNGKATIETTRQNVWNSDFIRVAIEGDADAKEVSLDIDDPEALKLIVSYLDHHKGVPQAIIPKPACSKIMEEVMTGCKREKWDATFIDDMWQNGGHKSKGATPIIYKVYAASNYLGIQCLTCLCAAKLATLIRGRTLQELPEILKGPASASTEAVAGK